MKKLNISIVSLILCVTTSLAQEHKISLSHGDLSINGLSNLNIEGYKGNEIIIKKVDNTTIPESAKGLVAVNSNGLKDNTGLGIAVNSLSKDSYQINEILEGGVFNIKLPENVNLQILGKGLTDSEIQIKNVKGNIEISTRTGNINLQNVSGPLLINSVSGKITAMLNQQIKFPISIISLNGEIDLTLPDEIYADLLIGTGYGKNLYTDMPINYEKTEQGKEVVLNPVSSTFRGGGGSVGKKMNSKIKSDSKGSTTANTSSGEVKQKTITTVTTNAVFQPFLNVSVIKGKLNGGGGSIVLEARNNNVYVRKLSGSPNGK